MEIESKKYPNISYEFNKEILALPLETGLPFTLQVSGLLTQYDSSMSQLGEVLDNIDTYIERLKGYLAIAAIDVQNKHNKVIKEFFVDYLGKCKKYGWNSHLVTEEEINLSFTYLDLVNFLQTQFLRYSIPLDIDDPAFSLGMSFRPDNDGSLLVVRFNGIDMSIFDIYSEGPVEDKFQVKFVKPKSSHR